MMETPVTEDKEPLTAKERMNRNILIGCMLLGGVIGMALALAGPGGPDSAFSNEPIQPWLAIVIGLVWGVGMPIATLFWQRYIDEQEADAYRWGAYYGFLVYTVGAPLWWILWRGGLVPEPNGVIIYYIVLGTAGFEWLRRKYG